MELLLVGTHSGQSQVQLQLSDPPSNTPPDPVAEGDGAEGVGPLAAVPQPPRRLKALRLWERLLVVTDGVVTEPEARLQWPGTTAKTNALSTQRLFMAFVSSWL